MRIFFVSDIHGAVKCFRKLVNAGKFYGADVLIMGGDLAVKQLVPVVARGGVSRAHFDGADFAFETAQEITDFERRAAELGAVGSTAVADSIAAYARAFRGHAEIRPYLEMYFSALPGSPSSPSAWWWTGPPPWSSGPSPTSTCAG